MLIILNTIKLKEENPRALKKDSGRKCIPDPQTKNCKEERVNGFDYIRIQKSIKEENTDN